MIYTSRWYIIYLSNLLHWWEFDGRVTELHGEDISFNLYFFDVFDVEYCCKLWLLKLWFSYSFLIKSNYLS